MFVSFTNLTKSPQSRYILGVGPSRSCLLCAHKLTPRLTLAVVTSTLEWSLYIKHLIAPYKPWGILLAQGLRLPSQKKVRPPDPLSKYSDRDTTMLFFFCKDIGNKLIDYQNYKQLQSTPRLPLTNRVAFNVMMLAR